MRTRYVLSWIATFALLILFGFPVALAGFTSNVAESCRNWWWLAWICKSEYGFRSLVVALTSFQAPQIAQNIIQGVFPPLLLAVLFIILPYLLKGIYRQDICRAVIDPFQRWRGLRISPDGHSFLWRCTSATLYSWLCE